MYYGTLPSEGRTGEVGLPSAVHFTSCQQLDVGLFAGGSTFLVPICSTKEAFGEYPLLRYVNLK